MTSSGYVTSRPITCRLLSSCVTTQRYERRNANIVRWFYNPRLNLYSRITIQRLIGRLCVPCEELLFMVVLGRLVEHLIAGYQIEAVTRGYPAFLINEDSRRTSQNGRLFRVSQRRRGSLPVVFVRISTVSRA